MQTAVRALDSNVINSRILYDCRICLNEVANRYDVCITWVSGHRKISDNCRTDRLTRRDTTIELFHEFSTLRILFHTYKLVLRSAVVDLVNRWAASDTNRIAQKILKRLD